ncbi:acetylornithine aminotransferase [Macrolepiota fuliginosa MF-IS2]|uniref:acetylornithine transaminase n=1 Tax=Macrolepiota fuliginosa MF-IS2 TaxID=1400762 RepID=A0A9P5XKR5_9AGAR|nr:acetylornithine aminotransferase [Macrolepiota fuliginosa MF-IS2]
MHQRVTTNLISATVCGRQVPRSMSRRIPHARFLSTNQWTHPTAPSAKYVEPTYTFASAGDKSKVPKAPLLPVYARPEFVLSHGKGSYVWDTEGRKFLDFSAGIAVNALGHADEGVLKVLNEQASKIIHASNVYHNEWAPQLASLLVQTTQREGGLGFATGHQSTTPPSGLQVFFSNSGTEANEGALKIARKVGKERWSLKNKKAWDAAGSECTKTKIVCFENAFHGRSMGALSVTSNPKYQAPFAPLLPGVIVGKLNDMQALEGLVTEDTCAVIVEPIQGEGGIHPAQTEWLVQLRKRCDQVGAVLIFDEIQCGLYRTGSLWAHSSLPVEAHPDMLTMAKPLANGYPIGAILVRDAVASTMTPGTHGTTFGGSPLACAIGHHVLTRLSDPAMTSHISTISTYLVQRLQLLTEWFPQHLEPTVRGRGLILGLGFKDTEAPAKIVGLARERGVFMLTAGKDAVRLVPSLNVGKEEVDLAVDVLEGALTSL